MRCEWPWMNWIARQAAAPVLIEYVLIPGVNDDPAGASELARLAGRPAVPTQCHSLQPEDQLSVARAMTMNAIDALH